MLWILTAFVNPALHGLANILDNYLISKLFKNTWVLVFYASFINILFVPFVFIFEIPNLPPAHLLPFLILISVIEILYVYPYFKALQQEDTSVVSSLFSLGKIFVPLFAFLIVGETLKPTQYLGFLIIILGSAALTLNNRGKFSLSKSFFYMLLSAILVSLQAVIYKYLFENISWSTGFVWPTIFSAVISCFFLFIPKLRQAIIAQFGSIKKTAPVLIFEELLTFSGSAVGTFAISLVPVTLVKGIFSFQPFFVLLYAMVFSKFFPKVFREKIDKRSIVKKSIIFAIMIIGAVLIV